MSTIKWQFRPDLSDVPRGIRKEVREEIADFILENVLKDTARGISAVFGDKWPGLSKDYKALKQEQGGTNKADLRLEGDMLSALEIRIQGAKIILQVKGKQGDKARGHNQHAGDEHKTLPIRQFIPEQGKDELRPGLMRQINSIISDAEDGN